MNSRRTLILMALVTLLPAVAAWILYFFGGPTGRVNYGQLLEPRPFPQSELVTLHGQKFEMASLEGKWVLLQIDSSSCDERCNRKLYSMRQSRTAQGKYRERVERIWLITDAGQPRSSLMNDYEGTVMVRLQSGELLHQLDVSNVPENHIWLIDPLGNLVLSYSSDDKIQGMIRDLQRLLRVSQVG